MNSLQLSQRAAQELLARRKARDNLVDYARYIEVPGAGVTGDEDDEFAPVETVLAEHHILTLEAIQRCIEKPSGRLMVFQPPGSAKSTYGSVVAPSWALGKWPGFKVIGVSYGSDMAKKFGRRTRSIIKQRKYHALFSTGLSPESSAADEWALTSGSEYMSGGILSGITGNRADCLVAGTMVETSAGPIPIENLKDCPSSIKVLSFNHDKNLVEFKDIEAFAYRKGTGIYRITTERGSVVEATGNHKFYTERGYIEASSLTPGDRLLRKLPFREGKASVRLSKVGEELWPRPLLQPSMQSDSCGTQGQEKVHILRGEDRKKDEKILRIVQNDGKEAQASGLSSNKSRLPDMQQVFHGEVEGEKGIGLRNVLQQDLCGHRSFKTDEREGESYVEARRNSTEGAAAFSESIQDHEETCDREGWLYVRDLRGKREVTSPSHRQLAYEQLINEPYNPVSFMPLGGSQRDSWEVEQDFVVSVERTSEEAAVFDIQISQNRNFFANGILVHNCVIIDDPIKGRQDADSEIVRQRTKDEYEESVKTRLKPNGSIIIIQTRWHEADLAGSILPDNYNGESGMIMGKDGFEWEVICLQAKCEREDDPLGRKIGEYIWPEWFNEAHWRNFEQQPRTWNALFQQRPAPESGDYFKKEWIHTVDVMPDVRTMRIYGASDYAVSEGKGDYTVHVVVGVDSQNRLWLLDLWRAQASSDRWVEAFCDLVKKWSPIGWAEETGQIKSGVGPFLVKRMLETGSFVAREQFPTRGDKSVRAQSIRGRMALSGLYVKRDAPFLSDLISEMMSFPVGVHDDQVDALGLAGQLMDRMFMGSQIETKQTPAMTDIGAVYAKPLPYR